MKKPIELPYPFHKCGEFINTFGEKFEIYTLSQENKLYFVRSSESDWELHIINDIFNIEDRFLLNGEEFVKIHDIVEKFEKK